MTSHLTSFRPGAGSRPGADGHRAAPGVPGPLPRQRRRSMLALGVALTALGALTAAWLFTVSGHRVLVLAAARNIPAGSAITRADLRAVTISASGVTTIPARQESRVTGMSAATGLRAGTLLVPGDLTSAPVPGPGQQLVPVPLKSSQLPASGLAPGDRVLVIATPGSGGQPGTSRSGGAPMSGNAAATVYRVSAPDQAGNVTVDLLVQAGKGPPVARQASTGQIALIVTGRGG